jgi:hypothetical protein
MAREHRCFLENAQRAKQLIKLMYKKFLGRGFIFEGHLKTDILYFNIKVNGI